MCLRVRRGWALSASTGLALGGPPSYKLPLDGSWEPQLTDAYELDRKMFSLWMETNRFSHEDRTIFSHGKTFYGLDINGYGKKFYGPHWKNFYGPHGKILYGPNADTAQTIFNFRDGNS